MIYEHNKGRTQPRFVSLFSQHKEQTTALLHYKPKHSYSKINWYMNSNLNANISIPGIEYENYSKIKRLHNVRNTSVQKKQDELNNTCLLIQPTTPSMITSKKVIQLPPLRLGNTEPLVPRRTHVDTENIKEITPRKQKSPERIRINKSKETKRHRITKKLNTEPGFPIKQFVGWQDKEQPRFQQLIQEQNF